MKTAAWILALAFGLAFLGASLMNARLIGDARAALAGAGESAAPEIARYHLAAVLPDTDDSFFEGLLQGIEEGAKGIDAAVQVFRYAGSQAQDAERYFEIAVRARVDGLIMYATRGDSLRGRERRAAAAGLIFIPVGTDAPAEGTEFFIGSGSLLQGMEGGKLIGKALGASARVGVILAPTGSGAPEEEPLYRGVLTVLRAYSGARIVAVARAQSGVLSGEAVAESMIRADPRPNAIVCSTARDTIGAAQVLVDQNLVGRILVVGADETPEILRYIEKGVVMASIVRDSRRIGEEAVAAFSSMRGGAKPSAAVETGILLRTASGRTQ